MLRMTKLNQMFRHFSSQKKYEMVRSISKVDVDGFAAISGDTNPIHFEGETPIVHGAFLIAIVSGVIGTKCPGPGVKVASLEASFKNACPVGSTVKFSVEVTRDRKSLIDVDFQCDEAGGKITFLTGRAKLVK